MLVNVIPSGSFDVQISTALQELSDELRGAGIAATANTISVPKMKADLIVGLTVATLVVSSVSALVSVLALWQSRQRSFAVSVTVDDETYEISNLNKNEVRELSKKLESKGDEKQLSVILG